MIQRACDVCRAAGLSVKRYGLSRQTPAHDGRPNTTYGMGGIDLCDPCWERIGKPKTRPQRAKPHRVIRTITSDRVIERIVPLDTFDRVARDAEAERRSVQWREAKQRGA